MTDPRERPAACEIEIVERFRGEARDGMPIVPNDVRINGTSVLVSSNDPVIVHQMDFSDRDVVRVTLTLMARAIHVHAKSGDAPQDAPPEAAKS